MPRMILLLVISLLIITPAHAEPSDYDAVLTGQIGDVNSPEYIWVGAIEVRLRDVFVPPDKQEEAVTFLRSLAVTGREIECRLTGERVAGPGGQLVGHCFLFSPTDGSEIDLGERIKEQGLGRNCKEPQAVIAIWPPVYVCE
jgi:hypothetical protein